MEHNVKPLCNPDKCSIYDSCKNCPRRIEDPKQRFIWIRLHASHQGRGNVVSARMLASLAGISEREVRMAIAELRRAEYPIASAVRKPTGYFVPKTADEARECQAHLYSRMREIGITARALDKAFGEHLPAKQMVMSLFEGESA